MKIFTLNCNGKLLTISTPVVMGILNVTPDSFYDGDKYTDERTMLLYVEKMLNDGAAIIDIGGVSTRPGAESVSEEEELKRVINPIKRIHQSFPDAILSIDSFRSRVAEEAIQNGVAIINDISAGEDANMFNIAAKYSCPVILMHRVGNFETMHQKISAGNILVDILDYFIQKIKVATEAGVKDVITDVGFGFSKTIEQNFYLLEHLEIFKQLNKLLLVGLSRKSMLKKLGGTTPDDALHATNVANTMALNHGANILRVHDVKEAMECIKIYEGERIV
ncbi:MAG: Dihydropteroate synthase [Bacteroidota bacterium]|nr:Dihydropteroate synthase [Bacteroidota bacterium]